MKIPVRRYKVSFRIKDKPLGIIEHPILFNVYGDYDPATKWYQDRTLTYDATFELVSTHEVELDLK